MYILGISAFYHDSAACIIYNDKIIAAAQEERFSRIKHDSSFPMSAIKFCIKKANIKPEQLNNIVFYEKPFLKFERLLETYLAFAPKGFKSFYVSIPIWIKNKLFQKSILIKELCKLLGNEINWKEKLLFSDHHMSHASSAFFPSPFKRSAILTLDGVGEWTTTSISTGIDNKIIFQKELHFPHSLGLLYSAFTFYSGFKVNSGEYKLMGLAPYGSPIYSDIIKEKIIKIANDGSFKLDMSYFDFATGLKMTSKKFHSLFNGPPRKSESKITQKEMDIAASIQKITEEIVIKICKHIKKITSEKYLCLSGGVALNCVANGLIHKEKIFEKIWIQPASGDAGGALGAALAVWYTHYKNKRKPIKNSDYMNGSYLGPEYTNDEIKNELDKMGGIYNEFNDEDLIDKVSDYLSDEKAIGLMQGRMEYGPRALGNRSIIADARSPFMQKQLNLKVKYRESFRPFAPSILRESVSKWFDYDEDSPYMLIVSKVKKNKCIEMSNDEKSLFGINKLNIPRSSVPAITHVDYSARIQTVHKNTNLIYHKIITKFSEKTKVPLIVNTSFNVRGEPIVCSPKDAFKCFMGTELDILVIGNYILKKEDQDKEYLKNYKQHYELD